MSILKVSQMGHPVLRRAADPVNPDAIPTDAFQRFARDMRETMVAYQGAGLAAPQVHVANRVLVYRDTSDEEAARDIVTLVNPEIEPAGEEMEAGWEGCLSIPGIMGLVPRHVRILVRGLDREGEELEYEAADFEARVIQHEVDHLDGILYMDRMDDLRALTFRTEYEMFWAEAEEEPDE